MIPQTAEGWERYHALLKEKPQKTYKIYAKGKAWYIQCCVPRIGSIQIANCEPTFMWLSEYHTCNIVKGRELGNRFTSNFFSVADKACDALSAWQAAGKSDEFVWEEPDHRQLSNK